MSHFGDLLKGGGIKVTPKPQPVVEKPAPPAPAAVPRAEVVPPPVPPVVASGRCVGQHAPLSAASRRLRNVRPAPAVVR